MFRFAFLPVAVASAQTTTPPNILFFLADDMGYGDAGYLSTAPANRRLLTPNMDRMVEQGMAFTDAYVGAPVCAPSRCTLITGRHSGHCTIRSNGPKLVQDDIGVAQVLKSAGYRTVHIGKWGLGTMDDSASSPMAKGFDEYYGQVDQGYCHNYYPSYMDSNRNVSRQQNLKEYLPENANASVANCGEDRLECLWSGDEWTNVAVDWLQDAGARRKSGEQAPFFMYLSYTAPHAGGIGTNKEGQPPVPRISTGPYANKTSEWGKEVGYAAAVTEMDTKLGIVLDTLQQHGLGDNTVTFFASDNGASNEGNHNYAYFTSSGPLKGFKRSLHEGGHRTPLIVTWPQHIPQGRVTNRPWAFWDFMATAAEFAGIDAAQLPEHDGTSAVPTLMGEQQDAAPFIYHEYCNPTENKKGWGQALRVGNWSAVCVGADLSSGKVPACDVPLLYDLSVDISQTTDLAADHPDIVEQVMQIMSDEHKYNHYCGASPPSPPTPPVASVSLEDLTGDWLQGTNAPMRIDIGNVSADLSTCDVSVTCVEPCSCCSWRSALGTASLVNGAVSMKIVAINPGTDFVTHDDGQLTVASTSSGGRALTLQWTRESSVDRNWADWTRDASAAMGFIV